MLQPRNSRYAALPLFLTAVCFILLTPAYWKSVVAPEGGHIGRAYENLDLYERVYPFYHYAFSQLHLGKLPLWNPGQLCGAPLLSGGGLALFQPLNAVFWLMPTEQAMALHAFIGLALMGVMFVVFARALGMRYMSAWAGALVYAFGGTAAGAMSRPELLATLAWAPLLFWAMRELAAESQVRHAVAGGVALGLMLLSGAYGATLAITAVAFAYVLARDTLWNTAANFSGRRKSWGLGLCLLIGLAISAIQWLPDLMWLLNLDNPRNAWGEFAALGIWPAGLTELPFHLMSTSPDRLPRIAYIGIGGIALLPLALFHRSARKDAVFFSVITPGMLILALWMRGEDAHLATELLIYPAQLGLAVLVGLGLDCVLDARRTAQHPAVWIPGLSFTLVSFALAYFSAPETRGRILPILLVYLLFLIFRRHWTAVIAAGVMGVVLYADLYSANANYFRHPFEDMPELRSKIEQVVAETGVQARGDRALIMEPSPEMGMPTNLGLCSPLACANGRYIPLTTEQRQWWQSLGLPQGSPTIDTLITANKDTLASPLLDAMSVRVVLTGISPEGDGAALTEKAGLRYVRQVEDAYLYVNENAAPRALWTPIWRAAPGITGALSILQEDGFDVRRACTVQSGTVAYKALTDLMPQTETSADSVPWEKAECRITSSEAERLEISVNAPMPGITVLADSFAPGWVAEVDGTRVPIQKVNGLFRGVATPTGKHNIVFTYEPWEIWIGLGISCLACVALILGALAHLVFVRKPRHNSDFQI